MANNPVQIVLNSQNYIRRSDVNPGGSIKDFYQGRNQEFVTHRDQLASQMSDIGHSLTNILPNEIFYAQVELQSDAWAKSHRPVTRVFPSQKYASFSGAHLGTMVVELTPEDVPKISAAIMSAEQTPKIVEKDNKIIEKPTKIRSEVGAIKSIRLYSREDKRKFSADRAIEWLADPRTGCAYYVEVFISPHSLDSRSTDVQKERASRALVAFENGLIALNLPIEVSHISNDLTKSRVYVIKIHPENLGEAQVAALHSSLLSFLDKQAIVRSIILPPILQSATVDGNQIKSPPLPQPHPESSYPVVGIIDSGVANIEGLNAWSSGSSEYPFLGSQDLSHGTFIAGLICAADALNSNLNIDDSRCKFFDLNLHPTAEGAYGNYYPHGFVDFLEQLDTEIPSAKEQGVRVFNMSLAVTSPVRDDGYGLFANMLDEIADKHDIIFILPAGNLDGGTARDEWPTDDTEALAMLAGYRFQGQDRIFQPADSIRALVVGALNPPNKQGQYYPSRYTRRGPGPSLGSKPDLAHIGGRLENNSGLQSLSSSGEGIQSCGTSYAAPLVARTVAAVDHAIEGDISREALTALVIHHAKIPDSLSGKRLNQIKRDFIGAGIPCSVAETLLVEDHEITLIFNGVLVHGHELRFQFAWPSSLVNAEGKCSGKVKLTLVHRPPVDLNYKAEFVRVNLDAYLRQEVIDVNTGESSFKGRLKGDGLKKSEKELVKHGAKWWPVKIFEDTFNKVGNSSQWRLVIDPLCRSEYAFPEEGVPFSVVLTIADATGDAPIFNEMRHQLQTAGTHISDIRTALRQQIR